MKKIITSILLAVSVSSSLLLAQNGNRLKATNQVTGCRLQVADNSKKELPSEDKIGQGAKITTNYELPATNCDNLGQDLRCHLMMDPKAAEEGVQAVKEGLGIFTPAQARKAAQEREATAKASADARLAVPTPKKALPSQSQWVRANKAPETTAAAVPMDVANPILEESAVATVKTDSTPAVSKTVTREDDGVDSLQSALQLLTKLGLPSLSTIPSIENILPLGVPYCDGITLQELVDFHIQDRISRGEDYSIDQETKSLIVSIKHLGSDDHTIIGTKKQGSIHGLFDSITLSLENGEKVVYQPNAIICHEDSNSITEGYYTSYRKEGDRWFKVNDNKHTTEVINGSADCKNIEKNCYVISYEKASNELLSQSASTDEVQEVSPLQNHSVQEAHVKTSVTPTKQLVPVSSAERKEQTAILNAMSGAVSERNKKDIEKRYQQADILWRDAQKAWDNRRVTQQQADHTGEVLVRAQERHERAEQALAAIDINQTILGRVATYAAVAGDALSGATDPHVKLVGFVAKGTSKVAQLVNKQWTEADVNSAKDALNHAEKEHID
ncbi:MAG TPA: hypothetical protein VJK54_11365, partial [Chthoniobacterales bacterium]|nr:hypothetical protein [Chthoniobacterales bacterium]